MVVPFGADLDSARLLAAIRSTGPTTRLAVKDLLGMGRSVVTQRLDALIDARLVTEGELAASTGGRAARKYSFAADRGRVLSAIIGIDEYAVALTDLNGRIIASRAGDFLVSEPADRVLDVVIAELHELRAADDQPLWGVGVGIAGPVEFASGRPIQPVSLPGWNQFPVRERFETEFQVPCWVDNDANLMALGELREGDARGTENLIYLYVASGVGAGLVSHGRVHRGENGGAGDIGHIAVSDDPRYLCVCGNTGCLSAMVGGLGIERTVMDRVSQGRWSTAGFGDSSAWSYRDVAAQATAGDRDSLAVMSDAGRMLGETTSMLINFFNPGMVVLGGPLVDGQELLAARVREVVYRRCLPIATKGLTVELSTMGPAAGFAGAAHMVVDQLTEYPTLQRWYVPGDAAARPGVLTALAGATPLAR